MAFSHWIRGPGSVNWIRPQRHILNQIDRYTEIGALAEKVRNAIRRLIFPLSVFLIGVSAIFAFSEQAGAGAFALITLSGCLAMAVWSSEAVGLPLLPIMMVQSMIIYGVPIAAKHQIILNYPADFVMSAGVEVLVFNLAMVAAWKLAMQLFRPSPPVSYALHEFNREGIHGWARLGFALVGSATAFQVLEGLNMTASLEALLPRGSSSILGALVSVVSASGFFLVSMALGGNGISSAGRAAFWVLLVVNGMISSSEFLLYTAAANLITVAIGFFWQSGRIPWRYLTVAMLSLSFLNTGKTIMRERYWASDEPPDSRTTIERLPSLYAEWISVSYDAILENKDSQAQMPNGAKPQSIENQTLLDRIDNLQNLLFVIDAIETEHVKPLHGATYTLIPPLLVPRIFWPDKPRSHEGQVLLNVHFGRQDLNSTLETYVAWGLLPEAYGNFGPILGALIIGGVLGIGFAWVENQTARKLVVSMEGFLSLCLLMNLMNSFEMVASVLVTATFQSFVIVVVACAPFVRRTVTAGHHVENA
jgi:hypothetical protein